MLLYPTVVLVIEGRWGMSYGDLLSLSLGGFVFFGLGGMARRPMERRADDGRILCRHRWGCDCYRLGGGPVALALGLAAIGLFGSIYHPVGTAWLIRNAANRGRALGWNGISGSIGLAAAPFVAGALAQVISWRAAFIIGAVHRNRGGVALHGSQRKCDRDAGRSPP
jgi:MFS transporter, FSR family, fosmidomycin resistance protein